MGKVLQFPNKYQPENPPEVDTKAAETRENFAWCEQLAEGIMYSCLKNLQQNGVNIVEEGTIAQLSFLGEVLKAVTFYERDIHHPLQDLADRFVSLENTQTPDGGPAIKGDFDVLGFNEWMEHIDDDFDDEPDPPIAV
tara:strand:- start:167 stop:580 length:414 start_codon:yes stop_codon:yes gene_type:complete